MDHMARPKGYRLSTAAWNDVVTLGKKITVTEVAALTGVNRASLSGLLGGHTRASLTMVRQLSEGLGVDAATLFPLIDPKIAGDAKAAA